MTPTESIHSIQLEKPDSTVGHSNESVVPTYNRKKVLPIVFALCLAVFLTALVMLLLECITM